MTFDEKKERLRMFAVQIRDELDLGYVGIAIVDNKELRANATVTSGDDGCAVEHIEQALDSLTVVTNEMIEPVPPCN